MNIADIKITSDLLMQANQESYVTISELAKELGVSKIKLMEFINDNPKLFVTTDRWQPRNKTVTTKFMGRPYKETIQVRGRHLGLCVDFVYLRAEDNYRTGEWLDRQKIAMAKYLHVTESNNYGYIQGYYLSVDGKDDKFRYYIWRNTEEKLNQIKDYLCKETFWYGGYGDSYSQTTENAISLENINKLKELGWAFNDFKPLSK